MVRASSGPPEPHGSLRRIPGRPLQALTGMLRHPAPVSPADSFFSFYLASNVSSQPCSTVQLKAMIVESDQLPV